MTDQGKTNSDVNHDGKVDVNDLQKMLKYLSGTITKDDLAKAD